MTNEESELLSILKAYPKIQTAIQENWHTVWLDVYLNRLITDTADHTRSGFPTDVFGSIIKLDLANRIFLEEIGIDSDIGESRFGFETGAWEIPKNF